ncbi:MAG: hypothetical protein K5876_02160 [Ruminiclostridium sp.]|nr:hypothetical protein [Ruminiclostridium sp.]
MSENINDTEADSVVEEAETAEPEAPETSPEEAAPEDLSSEDKKAGKHRRPKKDIFNFEKDIRYRGPLSYRHLKMLGWLCIVLWQAGAAESLMMKVTGAGDSGLSDPGVMGFFSSSALPLLLISLFAFLLKKRGNYKNALIIYGALVFGITGLFVLIYERYILGIANTVLGGDRADLAARLDALLYSTGEYNGFIPFNIFIDVFLCTLVMFFLDYEPKKFFVGKKLAILRALVVLPLTYEVVCIILKVMATDKLISLPMWISPFLTTKPPVSMLMFLSIVRYIKLREKRFFATGRTKEQYKAYLKTNRNSWDFSKHLVLIIIIYSLLDLILMLFFTALHYVAFIGFNNVDVSPEAISESFRHVSKWGFGGTAQLMDLIPIVLLFSYTRSHKMPLIDTAIPVVSVAAIVILYLDTFFVIIQSLLEKGMSFLYGAITV